MPYSTDTLKLVPGGLIGSTQSWSTGQNFAVELAGGSFGPAQMNAIAEEVAVGPYTTWWNALKALAPAATVFRQVRSYFYPAGSHAATFVGEFALGSPIAGTASNFGPAYQAVVASLRSDGAGASNRGRNYLPLQGVPVVANLQFSSANCGAIAAAHAALLIEINGLDLTAQNITSQRCVVSSLTKSTSSPITSVVVDSIPDTQHRREDKFLAAFVSTVNVT